MIDFDLHNIFNTNNQWKKQQYQLLQVHLILTLWFTGKTCYLWKRKKESAVNVNWIVGKKDIAEETLIKNFVPGIFLDVLYFEELFTDVNEENGESGLEILWFRFWGQLIIDFNSAKIVNFKLHFLKRLTKTIYFGFRTT